MTMKVGEYCTKEVVVAGGSTGIVEAAQLMRSNNVGTVVIGKQVAGGVEPTGIITDRDLVLEVLAPNAAIDSLTLADLPTRALVSVQLDDDLMDTVKHMGSQGIRRVPVVDNDGLLQGLLAMDDLLPVVSEMLNDMVRLVAREVSVEVRARP